jgi:phosphoribosylglycinamide formyltransferase-1
MDKACSVVVLISGNGSNLQALIDASASSNFKIVGVISNNPEAYGLERARKAGIGTTVIDHRDFPDRASFDRALMARIDQLSPRLVVLAGFMRILTPEFVKQYAGRILNIHPSLLPKYPGTNTHQRALDAGDEIHGVSVHFVTEDLDSGPVAAQATIPVLAEDTADSLQARVHTQEHRVYPLVVSLFASGRLRMRGHRAWLDEAELPFTGLALE